MCVMKQVIQLKLKILSSWDSAIGQINETLREYQDRNGELVTILQTANRAYAIIQYDA
ncbi:MAG: hypothetical protein KGD68_11765 [Candidatus Lokiarchaeota archaeon]|nr:hypothetical protein [Candidatus Lokiarchaeota archaeon]